ncbi:MAG: hypothetical protein QM781_04850 [Chitinophagaceae bacterium]
MASSFISFNKRGFWVYDSLLECVTGLLYVSVRRHSKEKQWIQGFERLLKENSLGYYPSYMHLDLDEFIVNEERRDFFIFLINQAIEAIIESGVDLDMSFMEKELLPEKHPTPGNWQCKFQSYKLLKVFYYFELMIREKLAIEVSDKVFYKF